MTLAGERGMRREAGILGDLTKWALETGRKLFIHSGGSTQIQSKI